MKINFCLYSNEKYRTPRKSLLNLAEKSNIFDRIFEYDREWLEKTDFYEENVEILDPNNNPKGDGWCLWKPYVILESLNKIDEGDILLYMDSSDTFSPKIKDFLNFYFQNNDILFCEMGDSPNKRYTRRDTFYYMGCDSSEYWESIQLEAGIIGLVKNNENIEIIKEYLEYCKDPRIIKDIPNSSGNENFSEYVDHRYDQSILTNIKTKYQISPSRDIRKYVECNIWEAKISPDSYEFERKISIMREKCKGDFEFWEKNYLSNLLC